VNRSFATPAASRLPLLAAALVAAPVLVGAAYAVFASLGIAGPGQSTNGNLDTSRWQLVLSSRSTWWSIVWSLHVAIISTALATLGAVAVAAAFSTNTRTDRWARRIATLPLPVPHLIAAASALLVLGQSGLLARVGYAVGLLQTPADMPPLVYDASGIGLILTLAWKEWPFLALVAIAVRGTIGDTYDEAATGLGARAWTRWRLVTWPLLWRGLLPSVIAVFVFALGSYETAVLLAPVQPVPLPVLTMERFADPALARRGDAYVLALLALGIAALAVIVHEWTRARWSRLHTDTQRTTSS
jgi:putative spermidine/putrescine transport system permease protein